MSSIRYIQILNNSKFDYQLSVTGFNFNRTILQSSQYSLPLPYYFGNRTQYILTNTSTRQTLTFVINLNGEMSQASSGLIISTILNGVTIDAFGNASAGVDQLQNNQLTIL